MKKIRQGAAWWFLALLPFLGLRHTLAQEKVRVIVEKAEVKLGNKVIALVDQGTELDLITTKEDRLGWLGVKFTVEGVTRSGWIYVKDVERVSEAKVEQPAVPPLKIVGDRGNGPEEIEIPALVLVLQAKSINEVRGKIEHMLSQFHLVLRDFISEDFFGQKMDNPGLRGIDRERPVAILVLNPRKHINPMIAVVPVEDFGVIPSKKVNGIEHLQVGTYALACRNGQNLRVAAAALQGLQELPVDSMKGEIEIRCSIVGYLKFIRDQLESDISDLKRDFRKVVNNAPVGGLAPEDASAVFEAELLGLLEILDQIQEISLILGITPEGLRIRSSLLALDGTPVANWLTSIPEAKPQDLAGLLPCGDALSLMSMELGKGGWVDGIAGLFRRISAAADMPEAEAKDIELAVKTVLPGFQGTGASSLGIDENGISVLWCNGYTGAEGYKDAYRKMMKFWSEKILLMKTEYQSAVRVKDGVEVDRYTMTMKWPWGPENPNMMAAAQMMKTLFGGESILLETAFLDNLLLTSMGQDASKKMDWLIENAKKGPEPLPQDFTTARTLFEDGGHIYGTLSLKKLVLACDQLAAQLNPEFAEDGEALEVPGPPVVFFGKVEGKRVTFEVFIPTKPFSVIRPHVLQKLMQIQQMLGPTSRR